MSVADATLSSDCAMSTTWRSLVAEPIGPREPAAERVARTYLDVPYTEKDAAKALGARWDPFAKRWFDPRPPTTRLDRWAAGPPVPDLLPGEDRTFGAGLFVDMVPSSCWFTNVRTCVTQQDWERLRRMIVGRAGATMRGLRDR